MTAMSAWMRSSLCKKTGPHVQGLFEVAVALFDDPLVFVDLEHIAGGQRPVGWVGQVGGQGIQPVEVGCGGQSGGLRRQAMVGVPSAAVPVVTVISSAMLAPRILATRSSTCF